MKLRHHVPSRSPFLYYIYKRVSNSSQMRASLVCASCVFCILISIVAITMARSRSANAKCHDKILVPFSLPGLKLSVRCAMDIDLPLQAAEIRVEEMMDRTPARPPQTAILRNAPRLLIAVTTGCCQQLLLYRRKVIRETWIATMRENDVANVDVAFFIAQPPNRTLLEEWVPLIEAEARRYNDMVIVRGADRYDNFVNKSLKMFRFALHHPIKYTHVLKTDDDTWVRPSEVMRMVTTDRRSNSPQSISIYSGCCVKFWPVRDPSSKWYLSEDELPDDDIPVAQYAYGYGYVISMDLVEHVVIASHGYLRNQTTAPKLFNILKVSASEDVVTGLLLQNVAKATPNCYQFQPGLSECILLQTMPTEASNCNDFQQRELHDWEHTDMIVRHLESESPAKLEELARRERCVFASCP